MREKKTPRKGQTEEQKENRARRPVPRWLACLITAAVSVAATLGVSALLLGGDGLAVVQGWLLARYAFVETDVDLQAVSDGALSGMVSALGDRWSYYLDEESYQSTLERRSNQYTGIGITVTYADERGLTIQGLTAGSPAVEAGLLPGEIITAVDGVSVAGENQAQGVELIGQTGLGETVTLTVLDAEGELREVPVTLAAIDVEVATGRLLDSGVGVVALSNFNSNSAEAFRTATDQLLEQGAAALIFDMRGNGGGYIDELTQILDYLLPEGAVFCSDPRWGFDTIYESDAACVDLPFAVLVDENTYSAAELFAAELRETAGAYLVGEVTSGKGYSQLTIPLLNGGAVGLSTAAYFTGSGVSLIGTGITPDEVISLTDEQEALRAAGLLEPEDDPQLQAALAALAEE